MATTIQYLLNLKDVNTAQLKIEIVMKEIESELVETGDKYYLLVPLYNKWYNSTMMKSTGVVSGREYEELVSYCDVMPGLKTQHLRGSSFETYFRI